MIKEATQNNDTCTPNCITDSCQTFFNELKSERECVLRRLIVLTEQIQLLEQQPQWVLDIIEKIR